MTRHRRVSVIAEIGSTHEGSSTAMLEAIGEARKADADVIKFQWVSDAKKLTTRRRALDYEDSYRKIEYSPHILRQLKAECDRVGIEFACTVYLPEDVAIISPYTQFYKISSFENEDRELYDAVLRAEIRPIVISLGMMTMEEARAVQLRAKDAYRVKWLHCVSAYPAALHTLQLGILRGGIYDGLSDHSRNELTGAVAVGAGAEIIETHVRCTDTPSSNADYGVSFTWAEFGRYVANIRLAAMLCGLGVDSSETAGPSRTLGCVEESFKQYKVKGAAR